MKTNIIPISIQWTAHIFSPDGAYDYTVPAEVPGCIHTDLLRAGIITDPFPRMEADKVQWIENCDVTYTGTFQLDKVPEKGIVLFHGLDCYCDVFLNGMEMGEPDNMFISWPFSTEGFPDPTTNKLREGENVLEVCFHSPIRKVEGKPKRGGAFTTERLYTRRIQCTYGWDWVARFVTMGIWKPVELYEKIPDNLMDDDGGTGNEGIYVWTESVTRFGAKVGVKLRFQDVSGDGWVRMTMTSPEGAVVWQKKRRILTEHPGTIGTMRELVDLPDPQLWYPVGYGAQPLYTLTCQVYDKAENLTCEKVQPFGIRTVEILETEDAPGSDWAELAKKIKSYEHLSYWDRNEGSSRFCLLVNGVEIFCKGANWVPCEPFPSAEQPEKIDRLVRLAKEAGVNMLRVWGGGIFENDAFYQACDREGIMVTQDFLMACGSYPEEDDMFLENLSYEAREAALSLRNHPSLVWWSGDNENAVAGDENQAKYSGRAAALDAIGPVLRTLDPKRRFLPSSPYGGVPYASAVRGTSHNTQFLGDFFGWVRGADENDGEGWHGYREYFDRYLDRFTAEQPAIGMPFVSSLRKFMNDEDIFGTDTTVSEYHTKNNPGLGEVTLYGYVDRMTRGIFGEYLDGQDRVYKMQMLHCEWIRLSLELFRRHAWYASGILYWMWNDCWPAANGWSLVDYYASPKPGYYAFMRCAAPVIASIVPNEGGRTRVYVSTGGGAEAVGKLRLYRYNLKTGVEDCESGIYLRQKENCAKLVLDVPAIPMTNETILLVDVETEAGSDRAFALPPLHRYADMAVSLTAGEAVVLDQDETSITLQAKGHLPFAMADVEGVYRGFGGFMKDGEVLRFEKVLP